MKPKFVKYNSRYLKRCAELVTKTWALDDELVNASQSRHLFYYYIRNCASNSVYTDLLVDQETGRVLGILFGSDENYTTCKSSIKNFRNLLILLKHLILGRLGKRLIALRSIRGMLDMEKSIEKHCEHFDSELNLFVISKDVQGQGYGRILMNRFIQFCKNERQIENIFLWTDIGCNHGFYRHHGFQLYKQFYDERLTHHDGRRRDEPNGFIYYKTLL